MSLAPYLFALLPSLQSSQSPPPEATHSGAADPQGLALPIHFERNLGQQPGAVRYLQRSTRHSLFITDDGFTVALAPLTADAPAAALRLRTARPAAEVTGEAPQRGRSHYLRGSDANTHVRDVPHFGRVRLHQVAPGIDLVLHGDHASLEYDWWVAPGADPSAATLLVEGADQLTLTPEGSLIAVTAAGELRLDPPLAWQEGPAGHLPVACAFTLAGARIGVTTADYDRARPLLIDPKLHYSTYLGGSGWEVAYDLAVDAQGYAYVCGSTNSIDFPLAGGAFQPTLLGSQDSFVAKIELDGSVLMWSSYLGGTYSGRPNYDEARSIAVDAGGHAYVAGRTSSGDFPTTPGAWQSGTGGGYVSKFSPDGSALLASTTLRGTHAQEIALDGNGEVVVVGSADRNHVTTVGAWDRSYNGGAIDTFAARLASDFGSALWSTYLGGNDTDDAFACALRADGTVLVTGFTLSKDFPATAGAYDTTHDGFYDAYLTAIAADGASLAWSSFLGGSAQEVAYGVVDSAAGPIVAGWTSSSDLPVTPNAAQASYGGGYADLFVMALDGGGAQLRAATYLGGSAQDDASGLALDPAGHVIVAGRTWSSDFPVTASPFDATLAGTTDAVLVALDAELREIHYATLFGGGGDENALATAVAPDGTLFLAGQTQSSDLPTSSGALQDQLAGTDDAFIAALSPLACQDDLGMGGPGDCRLSACGDRLESGATADLRLNGAPAFAPLWLVASLSLNPVPLFGGTLAPNPVLAVVPFVADGDGRFELPGLDGGGGPFDVHVQALVLDLLQPRRFALSNALTLHFEP